MNNYIFTLVLILFAKFIQLKKSDRMTAQELMSTVVHAEFPSFKTIQTDSWISVHL